MNSNEINEIDDTSKSELIMEGFDDIDCKNLVQPNNTTVPLVGYEKIGTGRVTVIVRGDVSEVQASVSAGIEAVNRVNGGEVISTHIIARPDPLTGMLNDGAIVKATGVDSQMTVFPIENEIFTSNNELVSFEEEEEEEEEEGFGGLQPVNPPPLTLDPIPPEVYDHPLDPRDDPNSPFYDPPNLGDGEVIL